MTTIDPNAPLSGGYADSTGFRGLTVRAELAARAMQGILAHAGAYRLGAPARDQVALDAVWHADALIAVLNASRS